MKRKPIDNQVAVITGAGSGIGRALAQHLAERGCPLVLSDIDADALAETVETLDVPVLSRVMDVSDRWAQQQLAAEVREWASVPVGVVVNNAGVAFSQTAAAQSSEDVEWVMNVNFWGVVHGTQAFLPVLLEQGSGAIVNISSLFGLVAAPTQSAYNASKFAVRGYTESLRLELHGSGVRAVCVHPGGVKTNIVENGRHLFDPIGGADGGARLRQEFDRIARTTPAVAAKTIVGGIDRGHDRILIGPDAKLFDLVQRITPTRYYTPVRALQRFVVRP